MTVQTAAPDVLLRPFLDGYVQRDLVPGDRAVPEPVVPRAGTMLEFQFAAPYDVTAYGTGLLRPAWGATLVGPIDALNVRLLLRDRVQALVVLFRPMGLHRLFGLPVAPFRGAGAEGHAVFGSRMSALYEQLGNLRSFAERVRALDAFLLHRLGRSAPLPPAARALHRLASGTSGVSAAARWAGVGERQLERKALELVGLAPKALARISRFQRAIHQRRRGRASWLAIAHHVGYYDQMHLIKDFHQLGGGPPTQVLGQIADDHLITFASA
ncbi:putative AraC-family regulatory protein [Gemmatimonadetes bacterium T265]|nr:putative AraC-family regulatory protein [Gemmatimonadetes bacterium T265]